MNNKFDVLVIGAGPGGYVAAIKAAQLGMKVGCVDRSATLGGTCLNVGCIPSKALLNSSQKFYEASHSLKEHGVNVTGVELDLKAMLNRKENIVNDLTKGIEFLFKKNGIQRIEGTASFKSHNEVLIINETEEVVVTADNIIIATGSKVMPLPHIAIDEERILSSTGALKLKQVPSKMIVIGGGYIGLEMASVWSRLGAEVTVIEYADTIVPLMDKDISQGLKKLLEKQGIKFLLQAKVLEAQTDKKKVKVTLETADNSSRMLESDVVLVAIGRKPNTESLELEKVDIVVDSKGFISVNDKYQTSHPHIYAIGDVIGGMMLAHKAEDEGCAVAEIIHGQNPHINYQAIPAVIYTHPEAASVGYTEQILKEKGVEYKVGKFPMSVNSRAKSTGETDGFVKIITHAGTDEILGVHILSADAGTLIGELALAIEYGASAEDIARTCHAHPTTSEAIKEAALDAWFKPIHL